MARKISCAERTRHHKTLASCWTINTSRTNHPIFSDDFPAARPANKETRCITQGRRQASRVVYCLPVMTKQMASCWMMEKDEQVRARGRQRQKQSKTKEQLFSLLCKHVYVLTSRRFRLVTGREAADEVPPLSVQDKTYFVRTSDFITRHFLLKLSQGLFSPVLCKPLMYTRGSSCIPLRL